MTFKRPIQICIFVYLQLVLPMDLIYSIITNNYDNLSVFLLYSCLYLITMYFIFSVLFWENFNYYLRYIYLIAIIIGALVSSYQFRNMTLISYKSLLENVGVIIRLSVFILLTINVLRSRDKKTAKLDLLFPFKNGTYLIAEGGDGKKSFFTNYHYKYIKHRKWRKSMRFAVDIVKINNLGFTMSGFMALENEKYYIYKEKVYSPINGVVFLVVDGKEDNIPYSGNYTYGTGNHVVIKKDNYYILLGHLKNGTINVKEGQCIKEGEYIGNIGNSGYTSRPHLHMQVVYSENEGIWTGEGIPFTFNGKFPIKNMKLRI